MVVHRIVMGEGLLRNNAPRAKRPPSPFLLRWTTEQPSPASELGFTRVRHFHLAEVG